MEEDKIYKNADLVGNENSINSAFDNDFIGDKFIDQLEWAMLLIQSKFKQIHTGAYKLDVTRGTFDKAFLIGNSNDSLNDNIKFFKPFTDLQATPQIFPNINIKFMTIGETVSLHKIKELTPAEKRGIYYKKRYVFEYAFSCYNKKTESFYGAKEGFDVGDSFFNLMGAKTYNDFPQPISLKPGYRLVNDAIKYYDKDVITDVCIKLSMAYQVAMTMFYEWNIYIKEYDNIWLTIPINPNILSEIYKTSLLKFENTKRMIHFVRDHYRRKIAKPTEYYSVYVHKYLRGENKFNYNGFLAEIIPPKYDLNRIKTKKKFTKII